MINYPSLTLTFVNDPCCEHNTSAQIPSSYYEDSRQSYQLNDWITIPGIKRTDILSSEIPSKALDNLTSLHFRLHSGDTVFGDYMYSWTGPSQSPFKGMNQQRNKIVISCKGGLDLEFSCYAFPFEREDPMIYYLSGLRIQIQSALFKYINDFKIFTASNVVVLCLELENQLEVLKEKTQDQYKWMMHYIATLGMSYPRLVQIIESSDFISESMKDKVKQSRPQLLQKEETKYEEEKHNSKSDKSYDSILAKNTIIQRTIDLKRYTEETIIPLQNQMWNTSKKLKI